MSVFYQPENAALGGAIPFVGTSVISLHVNDDVALSMRAHDLHSRRFGLLASDGDVRFENLRLNTREGRAAR